MNVVFPLGRWSISRTPAWPSKPARGAHYGNSAEHDKDSRPRRIAGGSGARSRSIRPASAAPPRTPVVTWDIPSVDQLPDNEEGRLARYGRSLVMATYAH